MASSVEIAATEAISFVFSRFSYCAAACKPSTRSSCVSSGHSALLPPIKKPFAPSAMVLSISLWSAGALNLPCSSYGVTAATKKPPISCIFFMRISPFYPRNGTRTPCVTM
jgi:hypothetical protein